MNWFQPIHIQVGCKRLGSDMCSNEPDVGARWIRLSQARLGSVLKALRCVALCCAVLQGLSALEPEWHTGIEMLGCIAMCDSMSSVCSSEFVRIMTFS